MFDRRKKAVPAHAAGPVNYVGPDRQSGGDMAPQSEAVFYVLVSLLFLPFGLAYGCYLVYRYIREHI